ncbi:MAG: hypothetical protein E7015_03180 [Alphaproteobacteria bacterium]|nr:hypothetical protein [Alphaproteobacteria bacterium]
MKIIFLIVTYIVSLDSVNGMGEISLGCNEKTDNIVMLPSSGDSSDIECHENNGIGDFVELLIQTDNVGGLISLMNNGSSELLYNTRVSDGKNLLMLAIEYNSKAIIEYLIKEAPDLVFQMDYSHEYVYESFWKDDDSNKVLYLANLFVNNKDINKFGHSLLTYIVARGQETFFDKAISSGADINSTDNSGNNILHYAAKSKDWEFFKHILINYDVSNLINARNNKGETPLMALVRFRKPLTRILALDQLGFNVPFAPIINNLDRLVFQNFLFYASNFVDFRRYRLLVEKGADSSLVNNNNETALDILINRFEALRILRKSTLTFEALRKSKVDLLEQLKIWPI